LYRRLSFQGLKGRISLKKKSYWPKISIIPDPKIALYFPVNVSAIYPPNTGIIQTEPEILLIFDHIC
jgi:hypothetical protein